MFLDDVRLLDWAPGLRANAVVQPNARAHLEPALPADGRAQLGDRLYGLAYALSQMVVRIHGRELPGTRMTRGNEVRVGVHVGLQVGRDADQVVPADASAVTLATEVEVRGDDFGGPAVQGRRNDRFLYLTWGTVGTDGDFEMFRRLKLWLSGTPEDVVASADRPGHALELELALTDAEGCPLCGGLREATAMWRAVPSA